ncbi:MAG: AGE family epimerase/isomerase [Christensenellaceae bacterium]|nr:AGE family epimerase/isomerase [Christensenellaceae bacterium]
MAAIDPRLEQLEKLALEEVEGNILPFWKKHAIDEKHGGFIGESTDDGTPVEGAPKCLILNARLVWSYASAYRVLGKPEYLELAKRAYDYFCEHFLDPEYGGAYYMVDYAGKPLQDHKMVYGNAFAIYGLAEYYRATGDESALKRAIEIFELLEKHAFDPVNLGYYEMFTRDWQRMARQGGHRHIDMTKTMNTHLHLIEAYTCLLRVWRNERMEKKVREHLAVMLNKVTNQEIGHFTMFFDESWQGTSSDVSYGHDIEGTWLMMETCEVLGWQEAEEEARPVCLKMAKACLDESIDEDGAMLYEYKPDTSEMLRQRSWWVQSEAVTGFLNAWQMGGGEEFMAAALRSFAYIREHVVDHAHGEWFAMLGEDNKPISSSDTKIGGWKAPYHNSRMCFELIERARKARGE